MVFSEEEFTTWAEKLGTKMFEQASPDYTEVEEICKEYPSTNLPNYEVFQKFFKNDAFGLYYSIITYVHYAYCGANAYIGSPLHSIITLKQILLYASNDYLLKKCLSHIFSVVNIIFEWMTIHIPIQRWLFLIQYDFIPIVNEHTVRCIPKNPNYYKMFKDLLWFYYYNLLTDVPNFNYELLPKIEGDLFVTNKNYSAFKVLTHENQYCIAIITIPLNTIVVFPRNDAYVSLLDGKYYLRSSAHNIESIHKKDGTPLPFAESPFKKVPYKGGGKYEIDNLNRNVKMVCVPGLHFLRTFDDALAFIRLMKV